MVRSCVSGRAGNGCAPESRGRGPRYSGAPGDAGRSADDPGDHAAGVDDALAVEHGADDPGDAGPRVALRLDLRAALHGPDEGALRHHHDRDLRGRDDGEGRVVDLLDVDALVAGDG